MAQTQRRTLGSRLATCLTAAFMLAASVIPVGAKDACAQDITSSNVLSKTGYTDAENLRLASAYALFMQQQGRDPAVLKAIMEASEATGINFELMVVKAVIESNLGMYDAPLHINGGARGLYQFLPATFLAVFARFGGEYENGKYKHLADAIKMKGLEAYVEDEDIKKEILALRSDHKVAAYMKAMQLKHEEVPFLQKALKRDISITDYYIVHFLGIPRAKTFYRYLEKQPNRSAAGIMRKEARYNRSVFYQGRKALSFKKVYDRLERILNNRLEGVHTTSQDLLIGEECVPVLRREEPQQVLQPATPPSLKQEFPENVPPEQDIPSEQQPPAPERPAAVPARAPAFGIRIFSA